MCLDQEKNIVLIDICQDNRLLMQLILERQGYRVTSIGKEEQKVENLAEDCVDLIVLELVSDRSNLEMVQDFKAEYAHLSKIPILLLAVAKNLDAEKIMRVDEVCYKPFEMEYLLAQIKSLLWCRENIRTSTIILDMDNEDPLMKENQKLQSLLDRELSALEILQQQGYEVGISEVGNVSKVY